MPSTSSVWDILPNQLSKPNIEEDESETNSFWDEYEYRGVGSRIHIAILSRNYLELILSEDKTIESRLSVNRRMPYERIERGDILLLKETGGPIRGISYVTDVEFVEIANDITLDEIKEKYSEGLQIQDESYWQRYSESCYGTFIFLSHVRRVSPMKFSKKDRNAWVIFEPE